MRLNSFSFGREPLACAFECMFLLHNYDETILEWKMCVDAIEKANGRTKFRKIKNKFVCARGKSDGDAAMAMCAVRCTVSA